MAITDFGSVTTREGTLYGYVASLAGSVRVQPPFTDAAALVRLRDTETGPVTITPSTLEEIWQNAGDPDVPMLDLAGDKYVRTFETWRTVKLPEGWNWEETPKAGPQWFSVGYGGISEFDYTEVWDAR